MVRMPVTLRTPAMIRTPVIQQFGDSDVRVSTLILHDPHIHVDAPFVGCIDLTDERLWAWRHRLTI